MNRLACTVFCIITENLKKKRRLYKRTTRQVSLYDGNSAVLVTSAHLTHMQYIYLAPPAQQENRSKPSFTHARPTPKTVPSYILPPHPCLTLQQCFCTGSNSPMLSGGWGRVG